MTVRADGAEVILHCEHCQDGINIGRHPAVGAVIEAYADHQKTISHTEQEILA